MTASHNPAADLLTIGMATYQDFEGVWATLHSLRLHHPRVKLIVVDNAPQGCKQTKSVTTVLGGDYHHRPDLVGTSRPRDAGFRLAKTPWVMCCDSHLLFPTGAVQSLLNWIYLNPDSTALVQGPLVYDDHATICTHWRRPKNYPTALWGEWDYDPAEKLGQAFEIDMQGLGVFAMRRDAWPGFNPFFRGFGGEEGYLHELVRRRGARALCLPGLRWIHRWRDPSGGGARIPYPLRLEDHAWNLLVGHRELGIDAAEAIREHFGKRLNPAVYDKLVQTAFLTQPEGVIHAPPRRQKLLGVWYTNNKAPDKLLRDSLSCIKKAADASRHLVEVTTCTWSPVRRNPFPEVSAVVRSGNHLGIIKQIRQCIEAAKEKDYDALAFLEHDVLYPLDYFDRVGDALEYNPTAPVVSNLDYEGLNETGWLKVKERHEPMHQLSIRREVAEANLDRAERDCAVHGQALLEPQGDRKEWVRLPFYGVRPSIHVNHASRFTSHGEVCYEATSGGRTEHPAWGDYRAWWPVAPRPAELAKPPEGDDGKKRECVPCKGSGRNDVARTSPPTLEQWYVQTCVVPSDMNEHAPTLRSLAEGCECVVEISTWINGASVALAAGKPKRLVSVAPGAKPEWRALRKACAGHTQLETHVAQPLEFKDADLLGGQIDFLFTDTRHTADQIYAELVKYSPRVRGRIAIHDTTVYGENGDGGGPGLLPGLRRFLREYPEWSVWKHYPNNNGLTVLTRREDDKKPLPGMAKMAWNYAKAQAAHLLDGSKLASPAEYERRLELCTLCEHRTDNRCSVCGCYLDRGPDGRHGKAELRTSECPLGIWLAEALNV